MSADIILVFEALMRMLEVINNDYIRRVLRLRHRVCVPSVELRRRLHVAQTSWRPAEDMGNHDLDRPGTELRTTHEGERTG